jgi:NADH-quinone oxidoreductase subunit F
VLNKVMHGGGRDGDIALVRDLADQFEKTTICPLATADAWPIQSFTAKFRDAFDGYVAKNPDHALPRGAVLRPGAFW